MKKIIFLWCCMAGCDMLMASPRVKTNNDPDEPLFGQLIREQVNFASLVFKSLDYDENKLADAEKQIQEIHGLLTAEEAAAKITAILHLQDPTALQTYYASVRQNWDGLRKKYGDELTEDFIRQGGEVAARQLPLDAGGMAGGPDCRDSRGFYNCLVTSTISNLLAGFYCLTTTDMFCIAVVSIHIIMESVDCRHLYCDKKIID